MSGALGRAPDAHETRLAEFIATASWEVPASPGAFEALALASFRRQVETIPAYGAYASYLKRGPNAVRDWREIPAAPASAFKSHDLSASPPGEGAVFETSGTTISRPGRVRLGSTRLYERSLLRNFEAHLLPDGARLPAVIVGPTLAAAPRSSLWFMADRIAAWLADGAVWAIEDVDGAPCWDVVDAALALAEREGRALLLLGTTLLFAAYFERAAAGGIRFRLPPGSRAMDTGGAKGRLADLARGEVEGAFARIMGIPADHVVNEYGMAEMASQFYDDVLSARFERRAPREGKRMPPWARTRVLDPETMNELPDGSVGLLVHYDLANLDIPIAIQTEDLGARLGDRLMLTGRLPEAERRGCSLPFERFLELERARGT
jgi:hypothetical protein